MEEREKEQYATEWCSKECCCGDFAEYDFSDRKDHLVEKDLARHLESQPDVEFDNLVVRRISGDTVCLEGVVHSECDCRDIKDYAKALYGVDRVINRLVTRPASAEQETAFPADEDVTISDWR